MLRLGRNGIALAEVADVGGTGEHAAYFHRDAGVHIAAPQVARGKEGPRTHHRQRARSQQREWQRDERTFHCMSPGNESLIPSKTNWMAMAPMMSPITRFITVIPVTPKKREILPAARSIR